MKKKLFTTAAITLVAAAGFAQEPENELAIDAQLRTRYENNDGAITPSINDVQSANFANERARLSMDYKRNDLEMKVSVQHTGVWGQDLINQPNGRTTMNEFWARLDFCDNYFAQIGRQQLSYDDERILGTLDWNVYGNWHDALKLGYEEGHNKLHLILSMNQMAENNRGDYYGGYMPYKNMQTVWYHYQSDLLPLGVSVLAMNLGLEVGSSGHGHTNYLQTLGTDVSFKPMDWRMHAAFYYQMGRNSTGRNVSAWMASAKVERDINPMLRAHVGFDHLSGNDMSSPDVGAFNALYGTHHKFYGSMDYFAGTSPYGLNDVQAGAVAKPLDKLTAQLDYHYFFTEQQPLGVEGNFSKTLGHELDLQLTYRLMKDVTLTGGYSCMLATETLDWVKLFKETRKTNLHKSYQGWAWVQVNINPRVLLTRWK